MISTIIKECKKYNYEFTYAIDKTLRFINKNAREELQLFEVLVDEDLERVAMAIIMDLGSWNEATEHDYNNLEDIKNGIASWISKENLEEAEKWFLEEE